MVEQANLKWYELLPETRESLEKAAFQRVAVKVAQAADCWAAALSTSAPSQEMAIEGLLAFADMLRNAECYDVLINQVVEKYLASLSTRH